MSEQASVVEEYETGEPKPLTRSEVLRYVSNLSDGATQKAQGEQVKIDVLTQPGGNPISEIARSNRDEIVVARNEYGRSAQAAHVLGNVLGTDLRNPGEPRYEGFYDTPVDEAELIRVAEYLRTTARQEQISDQADGLLAAAELAEEMSTKFQTIQEEVAAIKEKVDA